MKERMSPESGKGRVMGRSAEPKYRHKQPELLSGETAQEHITWYLEQMSEEEVCAAFMIELDNIAEAGKILGQKSLEHIVHCAGQTLLSVFKAADLVGQIGEDEFLAFMCGRFSEEEILEKAALLCDQLQYEAGSDPPVSVSACVGIYIATGTGVTFETVFGQAAAALYDARNNGRGSFCVWTDEAEKSRRERASKPEGGIPLNTLLEYLDEGVCLLEIGAEIRVIYASHGFYEMLGKKPEDIRLPCDIRDIGIHPDYETDYEKALRDGIQGGGISDHIHRIRGNGAEWVWRHVRVAKVAYPGRAYPVMLELSTDISELIQKERELKESKERLRVAFRQMPHILWEVDVEKRTFNIYDVDEQCCQPDTIVRDFPGAFLQNGFVHPDSVEDFRDFAENLLNGKSGGTSNFIMRDRVSNCYGWVSLSYRMVYDRDGAPVKAVGVQAKLPSVSGIGSDSYQRRILPEVVRHSLLARIKVNLTADSMEELWADGMDQTAWTWGKTYSEIIGMERVKLFGRSDGKAFERRFRRETLLKAFEEGERWSTREYRRVDEGGNIRWMSDTVNLVRDTKTQDIYVFGCFFDTEKRHEWENQAGGEIVRDSVTGIYTAETVKKIVESISPCGTGGNCALAMIRVVGSFLPCDEKKEKCQKVRRFIATALSMALGVDCIVGQYRPDTLLAFFPSVGSKLDGKRRVEDAFAYIRTAMADIPEISAARFVAGMVIERVEKVDYELLLLRAEYLCEMWKNAAMDAVVFPGEEEDWGWIGLHRDSDEAVLAQPDKMDRPLTKEEQNAAFRCVTDMLTARSLEASLLNALHGIGDYYKAARVYLLVLSEDRRTVTLTQEWTKQDRPSIRNMMSGVKIEEIPLLDRCMKEGLPIMAESSMILSVEQEHQGKWHFLVCPLKKEERLTGFLCVEDPREHLEETALLGTLLPYIQGEESRFRTMEEQAHITGRDALTKLPNLNAYLDVIYSMDSDSYSSMGVAALDIPEFSKVNTNFGFEYGKKLLLYISETLRSIFGKAYVFRTWDTEFIVLFPNTIQSVFTGRCHRLRAAIQRRYPRRFRLGYVWTEGAFSARNLVRKAQRIMRSHSVEEDPLQAVFLEGELRLEGQEHTKTRFVPYFQPKIDMRDGKLVGAEALARGVTREGTVVQPGRFIEALEQNGEIRELDLFILESVLKQLSEWKQKGISLFKVSINISRITLFNPTSLASILAIQSRYPDIPSGQIQLEITETAGDVEKTTLAEVVEDFRQCGICFDLDDFGSGYANMSILSNIKFDTVKLDRSLVNDLPENEISIMLVQNIIQICRNFGMECVAEGVETSQQAEALLKAGCVYGQGFYYARPLSAQEFENRYLTGVQ